MEADDSQHGLVSISSDSHDEEPSAVRRRLDLEGSFLSMDRNRTCQSASDQGISERTPLISPEKENGEDSGSEESLLDVTLTSEQGCDTSPSDLCSNVSQDDLVAIGVEQVVNVSPGDTAVQEVDNVDGNALNTASTRICPSGFVSKEGALSSSSSSSCISVGEDLISQILQEVTRITDQLKNQKVMLNRRGNNNEGDSKDSSETDLSCTNSSIGGSSTGFYGDIDEAEYTSSLASSADLLEMYENATEAIEVEKLIEEDSVNEIGSYVDMVSSKLALLQEIAAKELSNYCAPDDEGVIYERVEALNTSIGSASSVGGTGEPSTHLMPEDEGGNSTLNESASDGKNDISSEHGDSCDQRFLAVKDYVLSVNSNVKRGGLEYELTVPQEEVENSEARAASRGMSPSSSGDDRTSSEVQSGSSEESSNISEVAGEGSAGSDKEDYAKQLRITCKSAHTTRRIVSRQCEMISRICAVTEQRLRKMYVTRLATLNCLKGTANVASTALEAKRVVRLCLEEAPARGRSTALEVANAVITCSRFWREAVTFAESAVQLHKEAVDAVREAEALVDDIQFDQWGAGYVSSQAAALGDDLVKVIQQTSSMSLKELEDGKNFVESGRAELSVNLKEVKGQSISVENLSYRCDRLLSDTLKVLQRATISSAKAIDAAFKGIRSYKSGELRVSGRIAHPVVCRNLSL